MTTYLNGDCDVKRNAKCGEYSAWTAVEESSNNTSFVIQDIWKKNFFFWSIKKHCRSSFILHWWNRRTIKKWKTRIFYVINWHYKS